MLFDDHLIWWIESSVIQLFSLKWTRATPVHTAGHYFFFNRCARQKLHGRIVDMRGKIDFLCTPSIPKHKA